MDFFSLLEICQIRLDFKSTTTLNQPAVATGVCDTDSLTIAPGATTTAANTIPLLCGTLTEMHSKYAIFCT